MAVRIIVLMACIVSFSCIQRGFVGKSKEREIVSSITYSGGTGESPAEAIVINGARNQGDGVAAEYQFIARKHGPRSTGWHLVGQTAVREKNKIIDVVEIELMGGGEGRRIYYFDASKFLGKRK